MQQRSDSSTLLNMPVGYLSLEISLALSIVLLFVGCAFIPRKEQYIADFI